MNALGIKFTYPPLRGQWGVLPSMISRYPILLILCALQSPEMLGIINTQLMTTVGHGKTRLISLNILKDRVEIILCSWKYLPVLFFTSPWGHYIYPFCISICKGLFYVFGFYIIFRLEDNILSKKTKFLWQLGKILYPILYKKTLNRYVLCTKTLFFLQCPYVWVISFVLYNIGIC